MTQVFHHILNELTMILKNIYSIGARRYFPHSLWKKVPREQVTNIQRDINRLKVYELPFDKNDAMANSKDGRTWKRYVTSSRAGFKGIRRGQIALVRRNVTKSIVLTIKSITVSTVVNLIKMSMEQCAYTAEAKLALCHVQHKKYGKLTRHNAR